MILRRDIVGLLCLLAKLDFGMCLIWDTLQTISPIRVENFFSEAIQSSRVTLKIPKRRLMRLTEIGSVQAMSVRSIRLEESTSSTESRISSRYSHLSFGVNSAAGARRIRLPRTSRKHLHCSSWYRNPPRPRRLPTNLPNQHHRRRPRTLRSLGHKNPPPTHLAHRNRVRLQRQGHQTPHAKRPRPLGRKQKVAGL